MYECMGEYGVCESVCLRECVCVGECVKVCEYERVCVSVWVSVWGV